MPLVPFVFRLSARVLTAMSKEEMAIILANFGVPYFQTNSTSWSISGVKQNQLKNVDPVVGSHGKKLQETPIFGTAKPGFLYISP